MLLSDIRERIRLEIADDIQAGVCPEFTDDQLNLFIKQAVETYSRAKPHILRQTLTTIANQDLYAINSAAFSVANVVWQPVQLFSALPLPADDWRDDALQAVYTQWGKNLTNGTSWAEVNYDRSFMGGRYLRLFPCPTTAGQTVEVFYHALHPLNGSANGYDTIPSAHLDHVVQLAVVSILRRRARLLLSMPDQTIGTSNRVGSIPAMTLFALARHYEERTLNALNDPVGSIS